MIPLVRAQTKEEIKQADKRASMMMSKTKGRAMQMNEIPNIGKIGAGYDLLYGSPVCYTGACQMEGFKMPLFKLVFNKKLEGSCTQQMVPENVEVDCLPSVMSDSKTEVISNLEHLHQTTFEGIDVSANVAYKGLSAGFSQSTQTRSMIKKIVEENSTTLFTRVLVTVARITAFVPLLQLTDQFKYLIENMPCCNPSAALYEYIKKYIFRYFGFTYVTDMLLGGIAQQNIYITNENRNYLEENGFKSTSETSLGIVAGAVFSLSAKMKSTVEFDQSKLNIFTKHTDQRMLTTLGGAPAFQSMELWSKSIVENPVIIKFSIEPLSNLLVESRFPNDPNIQSKRMLIQQALDQYTNITTVCPGDCTNANQGICKPSGYLGAGICQCFHPWTGSNCSTRIELKTGTLAAMQHGERCVTDDYFSMRIRIQFWRSGFLGLKENWSWLYSCFQKKNIIKGPRSTYCGFSRDSLVIKCGAVNPGADKCPEGYSRFDNGVFRSCMKEDANVADKEGTLCGFHSSEDNNSVACDDHLPGQGSCPTGYKIYHGAIRVGGKSPRITLCATIKRN